MSRIPGQPWDEPTAEQDELIRAALMTLRDDVDQVTLTEPETLRSRYAPRTGRRTLGWALAAAAAVVAAAGIAFSQLGSPTTSDPLVPGTGPTVSEPEQTEPAPQTRTESSQEPQQPTAEPTHTSPQATGDALIAPCNAVAGSVNTDVPGRTQAQHDTATELMDAALACDQARLVDLAGADGTTLSYGVVTPAEVFVIPPDADERYRTLSRLLTLDPQLDAESGILSWPREPQSDADWEALVDAGILSRSDMELIRGSDSGYLGWRLGIGADGTWHYFVAGD